MIPLESRFFRSVLGDRRYTTVDWAEYFDTLIKEGIFADELDAFEVEGDGGALRVAVKAGKVFMQGYFGKSENEIELDITQGNVGFQRIDRVVLQLNLDQDDEDFGRQINIYIKEGVEQSDGSEVPPALTRDLAGVKQYEFSLAQILVIGAEGTIPVDRPVDDRGDEGLCGYARYTAKPAWYPGGDVPFDAWMYVVFKNELTEQEIEDIEANASLMEIINNSSIVGLPVGNVAELSAEIISATEIEVKWEDPPDLTATDSKGTTVTISKWEGTKLVRKENSYPTSPTDGLTLVNSTTRDEYKINGYIDDDIVEGAEYFYMLFPYSKGRVDTVDNNNRISVNFVFDDTSGAHGSVFLEAENPDGSYYGTVDANDGTKTEENIGTHFYQITGGSEGAPTEGQEDFNGANLLHYFGIASSDTWTGQNSNEPWVKYEWQRKYGSQFTDEPKICFAPKKSIAQGGNWDDLYLAGVVYGDDLEAGETGAEHHNRDGSSDQGNLDLAATRQDKWIEIDGIGYRIRLIEGGEENTYVGAGDGDGAEHYGANEWNTILYSLVDDGDNGHLGEHYANDNTLTVADYKWEAWTNAETNVGTGDGERDWCQETEIVNDAYQRVFRGLVRVSGFVSANSAAAYSTYGFRPILELKD